MDAEVGGECSLGYNTALEFFLERMGKFCSYTGRKAWVTFRKLSHV